jgi:hypothetical protein
LRPKSRERFLEQTYFAGGHWKANLNAQHGKLPCRPSDKSWRRERLSNSRCVHHHLLSFYRMSTSSLSFSNGNQERTAELSIFLLLRVRDRPAGPLRQ